VMDCRMSRTNVLHSLVVSIRAAVEDACQQVENAARATLA